MTIGGGAAIGRPGPGSPPGRPGQASRLDRAGRERAMADAAGVGTAVTRALRMEFERARRRRAGEPVRVLDVGGGTGVWAVPMAEVGCAVTVVDVSPNALAALRGRAQRAGVADRVLAVQGDAQALTDAVPAGGADLVLGHGLLEVVDDIAVTVTQLAEAVVPGGAVSVLVAGRHAAALAQAHAGRLAQARAVLDDPAGRWGPADPLLRRLDVAGLRGLLESAAGLSIEVVQGDGLFHGWLPAAVAEADPAGLDDLEAAMATAPDLMVLATRLHVIARRPEPAAHG